MVHPRGEKTLQANSQLIDFGWSSSAQFAVKEERYRVWSFQGLRLDRHGFYMLSVRKNILCHSLPFTALRFFSWLSSVTRASVGLSCLVFVGMAAAGAPLGGNVGEYPLLAPCLAFSGGGATCGWCVVT